MGLLILFSKKKERLARGEIEKWEANELLLVNYKCGTG